MGKGREPTSWSQLRGISGNSPPPQSGPPLPAPSSCQNSAHFLCSYWDSHLGHSIYEMHLSLSLILCFIYKLYATHYYGYTLGSSFLFVVEFIPVFHNNTLPFNEFQFLKEISVRNFRGCSFRATRVVFLVPFALNILFWPIFYIWQTHKNRLNVLCEYIIKEKINDSNVSLLVFCRCAVIA